MRAHTGEKYVYKKMLNWTLDDDDKRAGNCQSMLETFSSLIPPMIIISLFSLIFHLYLFEYALHDLISLFSLCAMRMFRLLSPPFPSVTRCCVHSYTHISHNRSIIVFFFFGECVLHIIIDDVMFVAISFRSFH